jgi:hypothetical protein
MPRATKDHTKYECAYCGARFVKMSEHMGHVISEHDTGFKPHGSRLSRPISCWACGTKDVVPSGEDNWFRCDCGWELPKNWVNGQLVTKDSGGDGAQGD